MARLKAFRARRTENVKALCDTDTRRQIEKIALEIAKSQAREQLDGHTSQVITAYGQRINHYVERVNAGLRITPPTHNYRGGTPNTSYQIVINQHPIDLGDAETPHDRPSFRNTLSAGDKSTLALGFFVAQLEQDPNRASKVVVFDDPFSSQDGFRRNHTVHQIYKCGATCAQVIVFSHEPGFLKLLWDRLLPADRKTLQLAPRHGAGVLKQSGYFASIDAVNFGCRLRRMKSSLKSATMAAAPVTTTPAHCATFPYCTRFQRALARDFSSVLGLYPTALLEFTSYLSCVMIEPR